MLPVGLLIRIPIVEAWQAHATVIRTTAVCYLAGSVPVPVRLPANGATAYAGTRGAAGEGGALTDDLVTEMLPILGRSLDLGFNVFDVMHHGTHEKQISNVFAWLLDVGGTHYLGDRFVRIFIDEVNQSRPDSAPFPYDGYEVRQEVNTASVLGAADIADIVLDSSAARLVVENYYTSDGHGHSYEDYLAYSASDDRQGEVVLLCRDEDRSRQSDGWENARILTYSTLIDRLHSEVAADPGYQKENPDALSFIEQLHRKFVSERGRVKEPDVLKFVTVMCDTGEAERFGWKGQDAVAEQFASDVAVQARFRRRPPSSATERQSWPRPRPAGECDVCRHLPVGRQRRDRGARHRLR